MVIIVILHQQTQKYNIYQLKSNMAAKQFHRHFPTKGISLYWILIVYLIIGAFYPIIGLLALVCMIAPIAFSLRRGRWWCGNACPRGNFYDRVLSKYSPHKPIPAFLRSKGWRVFICNLHNVRCADVFCLGRLVGNGQSVLEHHFCYNNCWHCAFFHICATHMVFILSYGNTFFMGST